MCAQGSLLFHDYNCNNPCTKGYEITRGTNLINFDYICCGRDAPLDLLFVTVSAGKEIVFAKYFLKSI